MIQRQYRCTLLSDIILSERAASEGGAHTLDFIPGSCFLGIVAHDYATAAQEELALSLFHTGEVRFGDAHPARQTNEGIWLRSHRVPAALFSPKLGGLETEAFVHHSLPQPLDEQLKRKQLKQARTGFYTFVHDQSHQLCAQRIATETSFALKSAHDREKRRSADSQLFGYEALRKGLDLLFTVESADERLADWVEARLVGRHNVGRSRSAEYGWVEIQTCVFEEGAVEACPLDVHAKHIAIYADSRWLLRDAFGQPTAQPTAQQLGFSPHHLIDWSLSQVRTYRYAPWNHHRQAFDAERFGIEKGSVIVVHCPEGADMLPKADTRLGECLAEGFGRAFYAPVFLAAQQQGRSLIHFSKEGTKDKDASEVASATSSSATRASSPLLRHLQQQQQRDNLQLALYTEVNAWVKRYGALFKGQVFASQWGNIRALAMASTDAQVLYDALFQAKTGYLTHGVAEEKWQERNRSEMLKSFCKNCRTTHTDQPEALRLALINLSAEMAKLCRS